MKTLSLTQPYATLVSLGVKTIETRSWTTRYRGPLAIHAAKGFPVWARELVQDGEEIEAALAGAGIVSWEMLPSGAIVAVANLVDVYPTTLMTAPPDQLPFGDFTRGRFAWTIDRVCPLPEPIPAKGALGLWEWSPPASWEAPEIVRVAS